jgi:hypothetical protein
VLKCLLAVKNDTISQIQTTGCNLFSISQHWLITIKNSAKKKRRLFVQYETSRCFVALHLLKASGIDLNLALNMPRVRI